MSDALRGGARDVVSSEDPIQTTLLVFEDQWSREEIEGHFRFGTSFVGMLKGATIRLITRTARNGDFVFARIWQASVRRFQQRAALDWQLRRASAASGL